MSDTAAPPPPPRRRRWLRRLAIAALILAGVFAVLLIDTWTALGKRPTGDHLDGLRASPQWRGEAFDNPLPREDFPFWPLLKGWLFGDEKRNPDEPVPINTLTRRDFDTPPASGLRVTWLGHSTFLIEIDGKRILTDPVFGERASPSSVIGPKRFHPVPIALADLPPLDGIVISHDHYDHLDWPTIKQLRDSDVPFFVPLGVRAHFDYWDISPGRVHEHDWWDRSTLGAPNFGGLVIAAVPARHFSGRTGPSGNQTLWCGWVLIGPKHRVFFSGDTAMFPGFADIGREYGPFDVTLIESGAYNQLWADVHLGPEQAVEAHRMVRGELMIPVHWGTFNLAYHAWTEPAERVVAEAERLGARVAVPRPGEQIEPASPPPVVRWWPKVETRTAAEAPVVSSGLTPAGNDG